MQRVEKQSRHLPAPREIANFKLSNAINRSFVRNNALPRVPWMTRVNLSLNDFFNPRAGVYTGETLPRSNVYSNCRFEALMFAYKDSKYNSRNDGLLKDKVSYRARKFDLYQFLFEFIKKEPCGRKGARPLWNPY